MNHLIHEWEPRSKFCSVSFGQSGSSGSSGSTETSHRGLDPSQSADLSKYVGPGLQSLYSYATSKLYPVRPLTDIYSHVGTNMIDNRTGQVVAPDTATWMPQEGSWTVQMPDLSQPAQYSPFSLPSLDPNGLYAGQTSAVDELLNRAYGGLNTSGPGGAAVTQAALPQLLSTIGAQTAAGTLIPEQVRQQRVQNVNAVLQLMSAALGGQSAGSGFKTFSGDEMNVSALKGVGNALISNGAGKGGAE
jgi:hypothetical protein